MAASPNSAVAYLVAQEAIPGQGIGASTHAVAAPGWLGRRQRRRAFRCALDRAYLSFARCHPQWAASLFDEHFIARRVEPLLMERFSQLSLLDRADVARTWAEQFGPSQHDGQPGPGATAVQAAADFLARLAIELGPILDTPISSVIIAACGQAPEVVSRTGL